MGRGAVGCLKLCLGLGQFEAASKDQLVFFSQGRRVFCLPEQELWSNIAQLGLVSRLAGKRKHEHGMRHWDKESQNWTGCREGEAGMGFVCVLWASRHHECL